MSARRLILVKHSLPEIVSGLQPNQWHLSDVGRARCKLLADELADYQPDVIISSLEPKAHETALIVASRLGKSVETLEELHEHDRSDYRFLSEKQLDVDITRFFKQPRELVLGKETADQARTRFASAIQGVIEKYSHENIFVVSHGTVITLYVSRLAKLDPFMFWKQLGLPSFVVLSMPTFELEKVVENVE